MAVEHRAGWDEMDIGLPDMVQAGIGGRMDVYFMLGGHIALKATSQFYASVKACDDG